MLLLGIWKLSMGTFYKIWDFVESFIRLAEKDINSDPFFFLNCLVRSLYCIFICKLLNHGLHCCELYLLCMSTWTHWVIIAALHQNIKYFLISRKNIITLFNSVKNAYKNIQSHSFVTKKQINFSSLMTCLRSLYFSFSNTICIFA